MAENAGSYLQRSWRPINGLLFGLVLSSFGLTACFQIIANGGKGLSELAQIIGVITLPWAGVVGVSAFSRMKEKLAGVAK